MQILKKLKGAEIIKKVLEYQDSEAWLCVGEVGTQARAMFGYKGASDVSIARRLFEMQKKGLVESQFRPDCNYREWRMVEQFSNNGEPLPKQYPDTEND